MKALILAAGFGTRLKPHTEQTPKPLFTIGGQSVLDRMIDSLTQAGCTDIMVNTHHLAEQIEAHIESTAYDARVTTIREERILGTGGAIANLKSFWDHHPFFVVNGDIWTDIDLKAVYGFHLSHQQHATLVLCDHPELNTVPVTDGHRIVGFTRDENRCDLPVRRVLTFTGIQVLDPDLLSFAQPEGFSTSIDMYRRFMDAGGAVTGWPADGFHWTDIGTPERYRQMAVQALIGSVTRGPTQAVPLAGDGSDRSWTRISCPEGSFILGDHGIRRSPPPTEVDAFVDIGTHLHEKKAAVPRIYDANRMAGLVLVEDLGNLNLQKAFSALSRPLEREALYRGVIDRLVEMDTLGAEGFDPVWTCQSPSYDPDFIVAYECRYFLKAFVAGHLGMQVDGERLEPEFRRLAREAVRYGSHGFMHRDCQSRNILLQQGKPWFIDFQGGRWGPIQYDLASLLIDPYVALDRQIEARLLAFAARRVSDFRRVDAEKFFLGYQFCRITRNLQILGAFGFLTHVKQKLWFAPYIPWALETLKRHVRELPSKDFPLLKKLVASLGETERAMPGA